MTRRSLALALVALVTLTAAPARPENPSADPKAPQVKPPTAAERMAAKLKHAEGLVRVVALGDYKAVETHATALRGISQADEFLNFRRDEEYQFQARVFQRSATRLAAGARDKNADAVLLAYLDMSASCVRCHQTFRAGKID